MENHTSFDLNRAIRGWRDGLAQSNIDSDSLDELEVHLHDSIAALQATGLSAKEAFIVGKMRLGTRSEIENEFSKIHHTSRWRAWALWSAVGIQLCMTLTNNAVFAAVGFSIGYFWNHPLILLLAVIAVGVSFWKFRKRLVDVFLKPSRVSAGVALFLIASNVWFSIYLWRHAGSIAQQFNLSETHIEIVKEILGIRPTVRVLAASIFCAVFIGLWTRYDIRAARRSS